jgi:hypothetical protein
MAAVFDAFDAIDRAGKRFHRSRMVAAQIEAIHTVYMMSGRGCVLDLSDDKAEVDSDPPLIEELEVQLHDL